MKLELCHADTCLPDYWGGHHLPHIQIVAHKMTIKTLKRNLLNELRQGAVAREPDYCCNWLPEYNEALCEQWYQAAEDAINNLELLEGVTHCFGDIELDNDDDYDSVYAFFVFVTIEE